MLRILKDNQILGILADQDVDSIEGVFVDFFGKPTFTPSAPVKIAMVSGAPIVPAFMVWNGRTYDFFVDEPIYVEKTEGMDKTEALKYYTQRWTKILESYIMKYPDQWVWMHRRWKTQPPKGN
jgi:KDO2-lipid IV(A) lauroyltransferase